MVAPMNPTDDDGRPTREPMWVRTRSGMPMTGVPVGTPARTPDFLMIGAAKTATTSIAKTLAAQEDVGFCRFKEPHFLSVPAFYEGLGLPWYEGLYAETRDEQVKGEGSTSYSNALYAEYAAERASRHYPEAKIVYVLREPVARTESECIQLLTYADNTLDGLGLPREGDALLDTLTERRLELGVDPVSTSCYIDVLETWERHFPRERIKVLFFEDLRADYEGVVADLIEFLGLPPRPTPPVHANKTADSHDQRKLMTASARLNALPGAALAKKVLPRSVRRRVMSAATDRTPRERLELSGERKEALAERFRPYNARLAERLGRDLPGWS